MLISLFQRAEVIRGKVLSIVMIHHKLHCDIVGLLAFAFISDIESEIEIASAEVRVLIISSIKIDSDSSIRKLQLRQ